MSRIQSIIDELDSNRFVFEGLLMNVPEKMIQWKDAQERWNLLEIVCHMLDEEVEDFRARVKSVLADPEKDPIPINPEGWVKERKYAEQEYHAKWRAFLNERKKSIAFLKELKDPQWDNTYQHHLLGPMSAFLFLSNWLAHDHLHIRQIIKLKFDFLKDQSGESLSYAGNW